MKPKNGNEDQRPDPKPRKHIRLYQAYKAWDEYVQLRKRHLLRISSIEKGKSNMDLAFEEDIVAETTALVDHAYKEMVQQGEQVGPIWEWLTSHKGLGAGGMAAQLLALVDDIGAFPNVAKLWRFAGQAVMDNGRAERPKTGEKLHYVRVLKSLCYLIGDQFIRQQTVPWVQEYYKEKTRQRELYPEPVEAVPGENVPKWYKWPELHTDSHVHRMARRKMVKLFLAKFWHEWREAEGFSTNGHGNGARPAER